MALFLVHSFLYAGSHSQRGALHQSKKHPQKHQHSKCPQRKDPLSSGKLVLMGQGGAVCVLM